MAEFLEVHRQFDRMCRYYQRKRECPMACPMIGVNISECRKIAFEEPDVTEKTVMSWAAEHPEPVYPTWLEYLARYCGAPRKIDLVPVGFAEEVHGVLPETYIHWLMTHRIPADTAQKLGLQPKEG